MVHPSPPCAEGHILGCRPLMSKHSVQGGGAIACFIVRCVESACFLMAAIQRKTKTKGGRAGVPLRQNQLPFPDSSRFGQPRGRSANLPVPAVDVRPLAGSGFDLRASPSVGRVRGLLRVQKSLRMIQVVGQKDGGQKDDPFFCPPSFCQIALSSFWCRFAVVPAESGEGRRRETRCRHACRFQRP